jgi:histidinol-phosphate aminotransferase
MSDSDVRLRQILDTVATYQAGKPAPADGSGGPAYKLSSNENPYGPLPSVLAAIRQAADRVNRYPDASVGRLRTALSEALDVPVEDIATGTGSVAILGQVVQATCDAGDEVVNAWRSFEAYPIVTGLAAARSIGVPNDAEGRHRLDAMAAAITERTRLVLLCTPNNPTGPALAHAEVERFLEQVPRNVLVVIDEAYTEFVTDPAAADGLELYRRHPNVAVLRTFSKAHGLAGLRVGYAVAHEPVASALRKTAVTFGVNSLAEAAAVASLGARDEMQQRVNTLVAERARVLGRLRSQGWQVPDPQGNFVWIPLGTASTAFARSAEEAGVTVRCFAGEGVRITIGEGPANDVFLDVAGAFRQTVASL